MAHPNKGSSPPHQCMSGDARQILGGEIIRAFTSEIVSEPCRQIRTELMIRIKNGMVPQLPVYAELSSLHLNF